MEDHHPFDIDNENIFLDRFKKHVDSIVKPIGIVATISTQRTHEVFSAWRNDLLRSGRFNFKNNETRPDHLKCAAHLTYWIRRCAPIVDLSTSLPFFDEGESATSQECSSPGDDGMYSMKGLFSIESEIVDGAEAKQKLKELASNHVFSRQQDYINGFPAGFTVENLLRQRRRIFTYANEYVAFDFGYRESMKYERLKCGVRDKEYWPNTDYIDTVCYFMKFKNVSPHSIHLIFMSLLLDRFE